MRRGVAFVAVLLTALTMGLEFAHVLEWPQKAHYDPALYARLQESLYVWFGNLGGVVYVLAVVSTVGLAVLSWRDRVRWPVLISAVAEVIGLVTFLTIVWPVNGDFPVGPRNVVPAGWAGLRDRWELGHAVGFVLFFAAFVLLIVVMPPLRRVRGSGLPG